MSVATNLSSPIMDESCPDHQSHFDIQFPFQRATTFDSLTALIILIGVIHIARSHFFQPILRRVGLQLAHQTNGLKWVNQNEESIDNFAQFTFRFLFRLVVTGLGCIEFWQSPEWWYDTSLLWEGYPNHSVSNTVQILYLLQLAYHLEDLGGVLLEGNSNRKDFTAMVIHHVVTALLLFGSTHLGVTRIGTIVSTLHAVTDVPKDFAKIAKTLDWDIASKVGFGTLVLTWIVARLYLYPFVYCRSAFFETTPLLEGGMSPGTLRIFHFLLSVLIMLNIMWFHMMVKLIRKIIRGDKAEDPTLIKKQHNFKAEDPTLIKKQHNFKAAASEDIPQEAMVVASSSSSDDIALQKPINESEKWASVVPASSTSSSQSEDTASESSVTAFSDSDSLSDDDNCPNNPHTKSE